MSTQSTTTVIGTKPMAALVAEWREQIEHHRKLASVVPAGEGWVEVGELMSALGMLRGRFYPFAKAEIEAGRAERFNGYAEGKRTVWYRLIKPAAGAKTKKRSSVK